jgi:hypothetical protein
MQIMSKHKARIGQRPLRGEALNKALIRELEVLVGEEESVSPISTAAIARRLALGSRTTLYEPARRELIRAAKLRQSQLSGRARSGAQATRNGSLESDLQKIRQQLNELRGYVARIAINAHRMGLQPDRLLFLSRREFRASGSLSWDRVLMEYLTEIGLLAKLDPNVRGLAR